MPPLLDFKALTTGALAFGLALAWNNAVETSIRNLYPEGSRQSAHASTVYAIVVTIIVILVVVSLNGISRMIEHFHQRKHPFTPPDPRKNSTPIPSGGGALPRLVNISWPSHWV